MHVLTYYSNSGKICLHFGAITIYLRLLDTLISYKRRYLVLNVLGKNQVSPEIWFLFRKMSTLYFKHFLGKNRISPEIPCLCSESCQHCHYTFTHQQDIDIILELLGYLSVINCISFYFKS